MPFSQADYLDVGVDDLKEEYFETSADSHRVVYEDFRLEKPIVYPSESLSPEFPSDIEEITSTRDVETVIAPNITEFMEGIIRYSGAGGGLSQRQFKQDAKAVYNKMLRDPQEHLIM